MIGFLQNSNGERSHTKLISVIVAVCIMAGWCVVCFQEGRLVEIDPTLLGLLGICVSGNGLNKWIESNGNVDKVRMMKMIVDKMKGEAKK